MGKVFTTDSKQIYGAAFNLESDVAVGWTMEIGNFNQFGTTKLYWNPLAYVQVYGTTYVNVWSPAFGFKIQADAIPY